jgi:hypothetical protein
MIRKSLFASAAALLLVAAPSANAALLKFKGSFSASGGSQATVGVPGLSGFFEFLFDDSAISGAGFEIIDQISLSSLTFNPDFVIIPSLNAANSAARLIFNGGVFSDLVVGGSPNGVSGMHPSTDDWYVGYGVSRDLRAVWGSVASEPDEIAFFFPGPGVSLQGSLTIGNVPPPSVPEPAMGLVDVLVFAGLFGVYGLRALRQGQ